MNIYVQIYRRDKVHKYVTDKDKHFHEKVQIWEVRGGGGAFRVEIHYGPAKNQPDLMLKP